MRACAALAIAAVLLPQASPRDAARADLDRRRVAVIRAYDLDRQRPRLDRFARIITRAFGDPALVRQAPLDRLPFAADNRREFLQRAAALVTARFGVRIPDLTIRFKRLDSRTAGRVIRKGDAVTVEVADRNRDDDEEIAVVVAHEFAHIVLEAPGSGVPSAEIDNEDLADATVVMAGLGPLMLRVSYREGLSGSGNRATWTVRRTGSLNPVAIAYLTLVQAELAGVDPESRRSLVGNWLEPAWSAREGR